MKKLFWMLPLVFLFALAIAEAGGPKTPIIAQTIGGSTATVNVTLCGASTFFPCNGATFACPTINIFGPDTLVKIACGPAGFKVKGYSFSISMPTGGCSGVSSTTGINETCNGGVIPDVQLKVGR